MKSLTSARRLERCLRGEPIDRVPIWMLYNPIYQENPWYPNYLEAPSYAPVVQRVMQDADLFQRHWFSPGIFYSDPACAPKISKIWREMGSRLNATTIQTPKGLLTAYTRRTENGVEHKALITKLDDLDKVLSIPDRPFHPDLGEFRRYRSDLGERALMMVNLCDPMAMLYFHCDPEPMLLWIATERARVTCFLDIMFERLMEHLQYLLEQGIGPAFFIVGSEFASPPMVSPRMFRELILRYDKQIIELIHRYDGLAIVHHHGPARKILKDILEMQPDGIQPLESPPVGDTPLVEAKQVLGERICLIGNIQYDTLINAGPERVAEETHAIIETWKPGGRFVLAPTAGPYQDTLSPTAVTNHLQFLRLGRELGQYA